MKALAKEGFFVAPHVFADVPADARIALQEIFGPVLCVIRAKNFDEAIDFANQTDYALTAGVYSRSPKNLDIAKTRTRSWQPVPESPDYRSPGPAPAVRGLQNVRHRFQGWRS